MLPRDNSTEFKDKKLITFSDVPKASKLFAHFPHDLERAAHVIEDGGIIAFPFNGIYGLFGNADDSQAAEKIFKAKNRPKDKNLILVAHPENIHEHSDLSHSVVSQEQIVNLWKEIHALGLILPASDKTPLHLVSQKEEINTVLFIWTEYPYLRTLMDYCRLLGIRALVGTSANKSGQPTHFQVETVWRDFGNDVDAIIEADFNHLEPSRYKSTTVVDLSKGNPKLHRLGNVSHDELSNLLKKHQFPELEVKEELIVIDPSAR